MKRYLAVLLIACIGIGFGCGKKQSKDVVATVNGKAITLAMVEEKIEKLPQYYQPFATQHKKELVDEMVVEELLFVQAKKRKLHRDPEIKTLINDTIKKVLVSKIIEEEAKKSAPISDDDVKGYYEENRERFMVPEMVRASHILTSTEEEAKNAEGELQRGADFASVAKQYSKDLTKDRGGDLGYFKKGQMIPEFEKVAFSIKIGDVSNIVKTRFGYHIITVTDKKQAVYREFNEVKDEVRTMLVRDAQRKSFEDFTTTLRAKAKIVINEELLAEIAKEAQAQVPAEEIVESNN